MQELSMNDKLHFSFPYLYFKACDKGTYGQDCSSKCGNCEGDEACEPVFGDCPSCKPGWQAPQCFKGAVLQNK